MRDMYFIKKCCEFADGFCRIERTSEEEYFVSYTKRTGDYFDESDFERIIYPLLLQRTIEGINMRLPYWISNYPCYFAVVDTITSEESDFEYKLDNPDDAKRALLEYIFQELEG